MKLALEIIKREIAQRELANKHDHSRKDICTKEIKELNDVVNFLSIPIVSKSFPIYGEMQKELKKQLKENETGITSLSELVQEEIFAQGFVKCYKWLKNLGNVY